jgi:Uma2 family endonuclease
VSTLDKQTEPLELHNGDRMTRQQFHRVYDGVSREVKAELIGGIVYMASPLKRGHGRSHVLLATLFGMYEGHTPGVECGDNTTILLGDDSEPQPDLYLRVLPEYGGQSRTSNDDYVAGAPEVLAEIAESSYSIDLHGKRDDYQRYGVREYLVLSLRERQLRWFDLVGDVELQADSEDILRLRTMPGLWIHAEALMARDFPHLMEVLQAGLSSTEHAEFIRRLADARSQTQVPPPD